MSHFGNESEKSQGTGIISFPLCAIIVIFHSHILRDALAPLLICIDEMDCWAAYSNNIKNWHVHSDSCQDILVKRYGAHLFITWNPTVVSPFPTPEPRQLHRRFNHPDTDRLKNVLRKTELDDVSETTRHTLKRTGRLCKSCQVFWARPQRFNFTLRYEDHFNGMIFDDLF